MLDFYCPYCNYFLSKIDSEYLETHSKQNFDYSIPIYPFGEYSINYIYDVLFVSSFLLRSYYFEQYKELTYATYDSILCHISFSSLNDSPLSNSDLLDLKTVEIDRNYNMQSRLFSNIFSKLDNPLSRILLEGSPISRKCSQSYREFYFSTVTNIFSHPEDTSLRALTITKIYRSKDLTESTEDSLFQQIFTLLYDYLIILNSMTQSGDSLELSLKIDMPRILNLIDNSDRFQHDYNHSVITTLVDMNNISEINDFYSVNDSNNVRKQEYIFSNNLDFISMNYVKCLLLVTYYYAEYKDLFL